MQQAIETEYEFNSLQICTFVQGCSYHHHGTCLFYCVPVDVNPDRAEHAHYVGYIQLLDYVLM